MRRFARTAAGLMLCAAAWGCSAAIDPAAIADAQTAARVKTALVNDPALGGRAIEVRVALGVVTLSGRVGTQDEADRALALARSVTGVSEVRSLLQIGVTDAPASDAPTPASLDLVDELRELEPNPTLLAVGGAMGFSAPRSGGLLTRFTISPLIRLGSGQGFGPTLGFGWFQADLRSAGTREQVLSRVHVKPVMAGVSYTFAGDRVSASPSIVGGVAFNSLTVTETGAAAGVPVEVDNSFVWRPGVSIWMDMGRRLALNVSAGYAVTRLRITILEDGRLVKQATRGDTTIVHAGIAYRLF